MIYEQFLAQFTDWRPSKLYWQRFSIAEKFGETEIKKVYNDILKEAKKDYKAMTELVMALNHKSWQHCEDREFSTFCSVYKTLFESTYKLASSSLKDNELKYFLEITD